MNTHIVMNTHTRRIKNHKNFDFELNTIEKLNNLQEKCIEIFDINKKADISRSKKGFKIEISDALNSENFSFLLDKNVYNAKEIGNISEAITIERNKSRVYIKTFNLKRFSSDEFNKKGIFKAFFPVKLKYVKTFHEQFETVTHTRNGIEYFYDCLRVDKNGNIYDVTQLKINQNGFYVIECLQSQTYKEFENTCFSIQLAIGFINTLTLGGEKFVFDCNKKLDYSSNIRPEIKGFCRPIITNPDRFLDIEKSIHNKLTRITLKNLSSLVCKIHNEPEFSMAVLMMAEANSISSLLIMPSMYAAIIELISKHLSIQEYSKEPLIIDNNKKNKIITELYEVIDKNSESLSDEAIMKLKRRLKDVTRPINKKHLTNNEKLTRPFEQLGIKLTFQDFSIIKHRNDLFHGNILLNEGTVERQKENEYLMYVSSKMYTLISKLILKSIGYKGYVYNNAKYLEKQINFYTDEKYFELL